MSDIGFIGQKSPSMYFIKLKFCTPKKVLCFLIDETE